MIGFKRSLGAAMIAGLMVAGSQMAMVAPAQAASISALAGKWTAVLGGNTGCGATSMYVTFTLNNAGVGTATIQGHSTGCPNSTTTGNAIEILTLTPTGQGTASLACGSGCGWQFKIQVGRSGNEIILADVDAANPNNTPVGIALRQFP